MTPRVIYDRPSPELATTLINATAAVTVACLNSGKAAPNPTELSRLIESVYRAFEAAAKSGSDVHAE